MILFDHVVHDLERLATNPKKCLLRNVSSQGCSFIPLVVGSIDSFPRPPRKWKAATYILIERKRCGFEAVRFADERTFAERHKEHKKSSELKCETSRQSRFYIHYPSKTATAAPVRSRRGFFDDLSMYCRLTFDRGSPSLHFLQDDENGIFRWDKEASENKREYMYSIGPGKDWFAHQVQEWQLVYVPGRMPLRLYEVSIFRCDKEASENKREYMYCTVLAPGRIGSRLKFKSGNSCTYPVGYALTIARGQKMKENISGVLLALRRIEASEDKREYIWCFTRASEN
jgi:hypothetical protein